MNFQARHERLASVSRIGLFTVSILALAMPAVASADGVPHLDPTNSNEGTTYTFTMPGVSRSMDPALAGTQFTWKGSMLVFQDFGSASFDAEMDLDLNRDGITDRTLSCSGMIGNKRFSMRCSQNDGNGELRFLVTGRAVTLDNGNISLRKSGGRGYTDTSTFAVAFQAPEQ